jgi:hypothetical protein
MIIKLGAGVKRDLPVILELEDSPGSLKLSDDLPDVLRGHGDHGGGHGGEHEEHEDSFMDHDTVPHEGDEEHDTAPHQKEHGASLMEQGHETTSHEASGETHETTHEEWGSSLTEEFPVSQ